MTCVRLAQIFNTRACMCAREQQNFKNRGAFGKR